MIRAPFVAAAAAVVGMAGVACAEPTVVFADGPGSTQGGIFHAATTAHGSFDTFCVEIGEGLSFGFTYEYTIDTDAKYNGQDQNFTNPLDADTAFIYTAFRQDQIRTLLGKPNMTDEELANAVQLAVWAIENAQSTNNADALSLVQAAADAIDGGEWSGLGSVRVLNVWDPGHVGDPAHAKQDTLVIVPLPSGAGLAGAGLLAVGLVSRRRE
ncbi:MAG TPA: hypothetical protein VFF69_14985 [Phycisphaerales bacterium]|nr:hypothetical protein [Phycisphaerales bacterium]